MIAVDAMGGDYAPHAIVAGSIKASQTGIPVQLFGDEHKIVPLLYHLDKKWEQLPLSFIHCSECIEMEDMPTKSLSKKKDASLVRAMEALSLNKVEAVLSAGNTGAVLVAATLIVGRIPGISRPAIGEFLPTKEGSVFFMDLGANVDCRPDHLVQFAFMANAYVSLMSQKFSPRIALLSNGHEPYKGNAVSKKAYDLLLQSGLNFIGNRESRDIFSSDCTDIVVCDGFAGNVLLKTMQGVGKAISAWMLQEYRQSLTARMVFSLSSGYCKRSFLKIDYEAKGGSPFLGVNKPVVVAHGCSSERAIESAIIYTHHLVKENIIEKFKQNVSGQVRDMSPSSCLFWRV